MYLIDGKASHAKVNINIKGSNLQGFFQVGSKKQKK